MAVRGGVRLAHHNRSGGAQALHEESVVGCGRGVSEQVRAFRRPHTADVDQILDEKRDSGEWTRPRACPGFAPGVFRT